MSSPRVSIIIPTFNRAALIRRAVDSVESQSFSDWELIVVDDGSSDDTAAVVESYRQRLGDRLRFVTRSRGGSSAARNTGIDMARGEFVAFLDSDDEFLPDKLARQLALFDVAPELGMVYSDLAFVNLAGVRHDSAFTECWPLARQVPTRRVGANLHVCTGDLTDWLVRGYLISTIVGMVRRSVLGNAVRFLEGQWYSEEWLFYVDVARRCRCGYVDEPLSLHHHVAQSLSRTSVSRNLVNQRALFIMLAKRCPGRSREADAALRRQHCACAQQLGWDSLRAGRPRRAVRYFAEAFRQCPGLRTTRPILGAVWRCMFHPGAIAGAAGG